MSPSTNSRVFALFVAMLFISASCFSQQKPIAAKDLQSRYRVFNRTISVGAGDTSIHLNEMKDMGVAWLAGREFTNGTIEFDIMGKDAFQQSFVGIAFHGSNDTTYEAVYFRPFNFRSTDPVRKSHAVEYIASPQYDWPVLRAGYPGKYEQPVSPPPDPNGWFHVRVEVRDKKISVYVDGNPQAALVVESLLKNEGKEIGFWAGNGSGGDWKNLMLRK